MTDHYCIKSGKRCPQHYVKPTRAGREHYCVENAVTMRYLRTARGPVDELKADRQCPRRKREEKP